MKLIILICVSVAVVAAKKINDNVHEMFEKGAKEIKMECINRSKVDMKELHKMLKELDFSSEDRALKCFWECLQDKSMIMNKDGSYNLDAVVRKFPFIPRELGAKCIDMVKDIKDRCEQSYTVVKCTMEGIAE